MQIEIRHHGKKTRWTDLVTKWLINSLALMLVARVVRGIDIQGQGWQAFLNVLAASALLGLVNALIRPILLVLTLPINILSLGLFTLVINGLLLLLVAALFPGFHISGFWAALWGSLLLSIISIFLNLIFKASGLSVKIQR